MNETRKPKIIFEIANNHQGDREHFRAILDGLVCVSKPYPFEFFVKFGYRDMDHFVHKDAGYVASCDRTLVDRLNSAALSFGEYAEMRQEVERAGFGAVCTPFDEASVEQVILHGYDYLKIASASIQDRSLLKPIAASNMPIIASTGGISLTELDAVVRFLDNEGAQFALMHCVGLYPTPMAALQMDRIDTLRSRYPAKVIGYSSHVDPNDNLSTMMAIAKGAVWLERHVGLRTAQYGLNNYSLDMDQVHRWLGAVENALSICRENAVFTIEERSKLDSISRGYFAKRTFHRFENITPDDLYLSFPTKPDQFMASDQPSIESNALHATEDISQDAPILKSYVGHSGPGPSQP